MCSRRLRLEAHQGQGLVMDTETFLQDNSEKDFGQFRWANEVVSDGIDHGF